MLRTQPAEGAGEAGRGPAFCTIKIECGYRYSCFLPVVLSYKLCLAKYTSFQALRILIKILESGAS